MLRRSSPARCRNISYMAPGVAKLPAFQIVDSTLREGEQFSSCEFTSEDRVYVAKMLDEIGVDYIEVVNPIASHTAFRDAQNIANMDLGAKILTHTRCHMADARASVEAGVDGVNIYMATSDALREHSHGKTVDAVIEAARGVIDYVLESGLEVRFSCEDAFRSNLEDILRVYSEMDKMGVHRVGVADTVGVATPLQVHDVIGAVRAQISPETGIEFHTHNDTGCCIANALMALEAGATHIDTCVLGIGERNGITPLGGFLARMYTLNRSEVIDRFSLNLIPSVERYVAQASEIQIPFNNYVTGSAAFTHKAGVHSKAVMANPGAYEVINPTDWGVERTIQFAHRLTGWNAMKHRAQQLGLSINDDQIKTATAMIKNLADERKIRLEQLDEVLMKLSRMGHEAASSNAFKVTWDEHQSPELSAAARAAHQALQEYEKEVAKAAVNEMDAEDLMDAKRPTFLFQVEGHLFDKAIVNRITDIIVNNECTLKIHKIDVGKQDEELSCALIQLWNDDLQCVQRTRNEINEFCSTMKKTAQCLIRERAPNPEKPYKLERQLTI